MPPGRAFSPGGAPKPGAPTCPSSAARFLLASSSADAGEGIGCPVTASKTSVLCDASRLRLAATSEVERLVVAARESALARCAR